MRVGTYFLVSSIIMAWGCFNRAMQQNGEHDELLKQNVPLSIVAKNAQAPIVDSFTTAAYRILLGHSFNDIQRISPYFLHKQCLLQELRAIVKKLYELRPRDISSYALEMGRPLSIFDWAIFLGVESFDIVQQLINGAGFRYIAALYVNAEGESVLHMAVRAHNKDLVYWLIQKSRVIYAEKPFLIFVFIRRANTCGYTALEIAHNICQDPADKYYEVNRDIIALLEEW